jgi:hypothetical protein
VYKTTPVSVTLAVNRGIPQDGVTTTCLGAPVAQTNYWQTFWNTVHGAMSSEGGVITGWQIPGGNSFAHKEYNQTVTLNISGVQATEQQKTTLDLNQQP